MRPFLSGLIEVEVFGYTRKCASLRSERRHGRGCTDNPAARKPPLSMDSTSQGERGQCGKANSFITSFKEIPAASFAWRIAVHEYIPSHEIRLYRYGRCDVMYGCRPSLHVTMDCQLNERSGLQRGLPIPCAWRQKNIMDYEKSKLPSYYN